MSSNEGDNLTVREGVPFPNNAPEFIIAQAYGGDSQSKSVTRLNAKVTQSEEIAPGTTMGAGVQSSSQGHFFEGQKSYVVLLDSDRNGVPDQMTGAYSLIYTLPESTRPGPVHSGVVLMDPRTVEMKADAGSASGVKKARQLHFEGTITIPKVQIKQGSLAGQDVTVQFDESNFQFPFVEEGPSPDRVHKVQEEWVNGRIVPKEKSPANPVVDGYLYVDE